MSDQSVLSDEQLLDLRSRYGLLPIMDLLRAVAEAAVQAAMEGQEPFIWASESIEEKQLIDGRPRRVFWECVNGVGIPLYTATPAAPVVPDGWKLVPLEPTRAMWAGLARDLIMWLDFERKTPRELFAHLDMLGQEIPQWLRDEPEMQALDHVPSKGTRAVLIYRAMLAATTAPSQEPKQ